jgi:hypothetical protein
MAMHAENRQRLVAAMTSKGHNRGIVLLQGGKQECRYDTDTEIVFRQVMQPARQKKQRQQTDNKQSCKHSDNTIACS